MPELLLADRLAVVTGSTRGIGRAIAEKLHQLGASVVVTGTKTDSTVEFPHIYRQVDFSNPDSLSSFANHLKEIEPDILVNNAGINVIGSFEEVRLEDFNRVYQVNVIAPFLCSQAALKGMKRKKWGRIVNMSSIWGKISKEKRAAYSASKFALDGLTAALSAEVAHLGILANCVAPGFIDTDLARQTLGEDGMRAMAAQVPVRRLGTPDEIAEFVAWLAGPQNTFITGQNIAIDGGFTRV